MNAEVLKYANDLQHEINDIEEAIRRVHPYDSTKVTITIEKENGCGDDNGKVVIDTIRQNIYNNTICAAMEEVLRNYRDSLQREFNSITGKETDEDVERMKNERPIGLMKRLWKKWHKNGWW